jgi:tRNA (guanine-N7-)-methyltransferase
MRTLKPTKITSLDFDNAFEKGDVLAHLDFASAKSHSPMRTIKSFVIREGRLTPGQEKALDLVWEKYVLPTDTTTDWNTIFPQPAHPLILEIGFGMGHALLHNARARPDCNFIGVEVYRPGIGALLAGVEAEKHSNVRVFYGDAVEVLQRCLPNNTLDGVHIFFPDPWPKRRHHKRRLIQTAFVQLLAQKLKVGGKLHLATDWEDYAKHMQQVLSPLTEWIALPSETDKKNRPLTKYERRGQKLGHAVWDGVFQKI